MACPPGLSPAMAFHHRDRMAMLGKPICRRQAGHAYSEETKTVVIEPFFFFFFFFFFFSMYVYFVQFRALLNITNSGA